MRRVDLPRPDPSIHQVQREVADFSARRQLTMLRHCGLQPDLHMLEIGCGIGRLAHELGPFLDRGSYVGFDISPTAIGWLKEHYAPLLLNFRFDVLDVYNARYNRRNTSSARTIRWPYDDESFDFACAFSVFTHMRLPEVENYLAELRRVLRRGSPGALTFLLITDRDQPPLVHGSYPLVPVDDVTYTRSIEEPERGIAFRDAAVRESVERVGLTIADSIDGTWHGWETREPRIAQDLLVVTPQDIADRSGYKNRR